MKQLPATFNARAESVADKPMFRDAFKRHRCIIPASGYYKWIARPDGKQPYFISAADGGVLSFAGLWGRSKTPETACGVVHDHRDGCQCTDASDSRFRALAERRGRRGASQVGRGGSPAHVAGVQARQQDRQRR